MENQFILDLHKTGNQETKELLEKQYPKLFVKTSLLEQAIAYLSEKDEEVIKLRKLETLQGIDNLLAEQKLVVIFRFKNGKHIFNWRDLNEQKWFLYWDLDGFRLHVAYSYDVISFSSARLCLKTEELALELSKENEILEYYKL